MRYAEDDFASITQSWQRFRDILPKSYCKFRNNIKISVFLAIGFTWLLLFSGCRTLERAAKDIPENSNLILAPAEGKIFTIVDIGESEIPMIRDAGKTALLTELKGMLPGKNRLVLIFMNPLNRHEMLSPLKGRITMASLQPGKFRNLLGKSAYLENERASILIEGDIKIALIPIAGFLYRRIVLNLKADDLVTQGQKLGKILMGSAVGVILPQQCEILVKVGEKVKAGKSAIARILPNDSSPY